MFTTDSSFPLFMLAVLMIGLLGSSCSSIPKDTKSFIEEKQGPAKDSQIKNHK